MDPMHVRNLANQVLAARPEWHLGAILKALTANEDRGSLDELRAAALHAAEDQSARTPAAIGFKEHWTATKTTESEPPGYNPLPECRHCGQPRNRHTRPAHCPNCGRAWFDLLVGDTERARLLDACPSCGRRQRRGFPHCHECGHRMFGADPVLAPPPNPLIPERARLTVAEAPVLIGQVVQDVDDWDERTPE